MNPALRERFLQACGALFDVLSEIGVEGERPAALAHPEIATSRRNPYGSKTLFLEAAAREDFKTFPIGRGIGALWVDVLEGMKARPLPGRKVKKKPAQTAPSAPANDTAPVDRHVQQLEAVLQRSGAVGGRKAARG